MRHGKPLAGPTVVPWHARPGEAMQNVDRGASGVVRLRAGRFKGSLALYDDDESGVAFVYPWGPPPAGYVTCRPSSLAKATEGEVELWWSVNGNQIATRRALKQLDEGE